MPRISYESAAAGAEGRLSRRDAARFLGTQSKTLAEWKRTGKGPPSHKIGGMCFYYTDDLRAYVRKAAGRDN
ncbi:hypothetical protein BV98_000879 [Sphingobium herbicidovorans NBRC 16415]|uniref:Helix-turn-helix domain-containing protein n=1 Tax=Sphingobium herbicidovorans (strain ATCC 700291 / DSM 11019 / CCUG 56400 / KCTC 2939 / LMG 18315 / NBRC 16415 / MH) TaxID=1219045 RepID=A0A086PDB8_SPHHM|nr:hypothetical protein BV98_000879 [Sphingobium herbicidovorans NBRC 16415]